MDLSAVTRELSLQLNREALEKIVTFPATPVLLIEDIDAKKVEEWLSTLGCTTYGRTLTISDEEGRKEYADWFVAQIRKFYAYNAVHR